MFHLKILLITFFLIIFSNNLFGLDLKTDTEKLNRKNVINYLKQINIKYPDVAYAQALLESGSFKSKLCVRNHNLFGMHVATNRVNTTIGYRYHYARYENWRKSVDDYKLFQEQLFKRKELTKTQYLNFLNRRYAKSSGYKLKVLKLMKKFQ